VNMWKRFQMPAHRRKGPQRPIAVAMRSTGRAPKERKPRCGPLGPTTSWHLTSPDRRGAMLGPSPAAVGFGPARCLRPRRRCTRGRLGAAGGALCRLRATFAHPNAYPQTNYGAIVAGQLSKKQLFLLYFLSCTKPLEPISGVDLPRRPCCSEAVRVKGFGCRPRTAGRRIPAAGVRKPPGEETAIGERVAGPRALWGFQRTAWGFGLRMARLVGRIVDLSAYHGRVAEVCGGIERWRSAGRWRPAWPIRASAAMAGREPANTAGSIVAL
jgi:hypothetical protein